jgi:hypothetical protein
MRRGCVPRTATATARALQAAALLIVALFFLAILVHVLAKDGSAVAPAGAVPWARSAPSALMAHSGLAVWIRSGLACSARTSAYA